MNDSDIKRFVRSEIAKQLNILLTGVAGNTDPERFTQDIETLYPGAATISGRWVAHPYGFYSWAPPGVMQVVGRQGESPTNRIILLHRDPNRPTSIAEGTSIMYSLAGYRVYAGPDGIYVGKDGQDNALTLGTPLEEFLGQLLDLLIAHVHPSPGAPSDKSADFQSLKVNYVENDALLSTGAGGLG